MNYTLNTSVRIIQFGEIFCFRKGLFDYNEATLDISNESNELKSVMFSIISLLFNNNSFELDEYLKKLDEADSKKLDEVVKALFYSDILIDTETKNISEQVTRTLLGDLSFITNKEEVENKKSLFICDDNYTNECALSLSKKININIDIANNDLKLSLQSINLFEKMDALETIDNLNEYSKLFQDYDCVVICQSKLNILMMRNLNEIMNKLNKQFILSFIDGPFIHICSFNPPKSADFDSFERRLLSRLEDHSMYRNYASQPITTINKVNNAYIPLLNTLMNLSICEAFLIMYTGSSKFEGRLLSIYIPTLEIQVQDILKMPNSSTQGALAKSKFMDNQINTRMLVRELNKI